jgi:hypothetical protein
MTPEGNVFAHRERPIGQGLLDIDVHAPNLNE